MATREVINLGEIDIVVTRKAVKHVHLSVHPPSGLVTLIAPDATRLDVARAYAISKLPWIRSQQAQLKAQAREPVRRYLTRETHFVWGQPCLLEVTFANAKPSVIQDHDRLLMAVRPSAPVEKRAKVLDAWYKEQLHDAIPPFIKRWEKKLGVSCQGYHLQRMKTKWGSCSSLKRTIRLNTELAKKPRHLLEYIVMHELVHLIEPSHNERFKSLLDHHYPLWRESRVELNALPLGADL